MVSRHSKRLAGVARSFASSNVSVRCLVTGRGFRKACQIWLKDYY